MSSRYPTISTPFSPLQEQPCYASSSWAVVCVDSGADCAVVGWAQAKSYAHCARLPWNLRISYVIFRFGDHFSPLVPILFARSPVLGHGFMMLDIHVVRADVPLILGLDALRAFGLKINLVQRYLCSSDLGRRPPLSDTSGQAFISPFLYSKRSALLSRETRRWKDRRPLR